MASKKCHFLKKLMIKRIDKKKKELIYYESTTYLKNLNSLRVDSILIDSSTRECFN